MTYNVGTAASIQNVALIYTLAIVSHVDEKPEIYKISISIFSRISLQKIVDREIQSQSSFIFVRVPNDTIVADIKYVDYTVAKSIMSVITDWESVLPCAPKNSFYTWMQKYSHFVPRVARLTVTILCIVIFIFETPSFFDTVGKSVDNNLSALCIFMYASCAVIYFFNVLSQWVGQYVESKIDRWRSLSYLKLNKADEKKITEILRRNNTTIQKAAAGFISLLFMPIFIKVVSSLIVRYIVGK